MTQNSRSLFKKWVNIPENEQFNPDRPSLEAACSGNRTMGGILNYFLFRASQEAEYQRLDESCKVVTISISRTDILKAIRISEKSLIGYLKAFNQLGYIRSIRYSHSNSYEVDFEAVNEGIAHPPERKLRGRPKKQRESLPNSDEENTSTFEENTSGIAFEHGKNVEVFSGKFTELANKFTELAHFLKELAKKFTELSNSESPQPTLQAISGLFLEASNIIDSVDSKDRAFVTSADAPATPSRTENDNHSYSLQSPGYTNPAQKGHAHEPGAAGTADHPPSALPGTRHLAAIPELEGSTPPPAQVTARTEKGVHDVPVINDHPDPGAAVHEWQVAGDLSVLDRGVHGEAETLEPATPKIPFEPPGRVRLPSKPQETPSQQQIGATHGPIREEISSSASRDMAHGHGNTATRDAVEVPGAFVASQQTPAPVLSPPSPAHSPMSETMPSQANSVPPVVEKPAAIASSATTTPHGGSAQRDAGASKGKKPAKSAKETPVPQAKEEITLSEDAQVVFDAWCSLFHVEVPLSKGNAQAAKSLVKPIAVWSGLLNKSSAAVLDDIKDWLYENDKNGYYKGRGVKLYDVSREFEGWQVDQERKRKQEERRRRQEEQAQANGNGHLPPVPDPPLLPVLPPQRTPRRMIPRD